MMMQKTIWTNSVLHFFKCAGVCVCLLLSSAYAEESKSATAATATNTSSSSTWTLAATPFSFDKRYSSVASVTTVAQDIPQLLLEQIAADSKRVISSREYLLRDFESLHQERLSLLLELTSAHTARDALVLQYDTPRELQKAIEKQEKKIKTITDKLDTNALATKEKQQQILVARDGPTINRNESEKTESISLYKQSSTALYEIPENSKGLSYDSYAFIQQVLKDDIDGLLTGSISILGDYVAVTVEFHLYPSGETIATVTDIGSLSDSIQIAENLSRSLLPKITNSRPVRLHFFMEPEVVALIAVDGIIVSDLHNDFYTAAGIHTISIEAEGYSSILLDYAFVDTSSFAIRVHMQKEHVGSVHIRVLPSVFGTLYTNVIDADVITPEKNTASITVNGKPLLGSFIDTNKQDLFFYLPASLAVDGKSLSIDEEPFDVTADIEKHRRRMYTAYSAFILSLPVSFYTYGKFLNYNSASSLYSMSFDESDVWQRRCWASVGVSVGLGAIFVYQLIRYLKAADNVLPVTVEEDHRNKK